MAYWPASTVFGSSLLSFPKRQTLPPLQKLDISACLGQHAAQALRSYTDKLSRE